MLGLCAAARIKEKYLTIFIFSGDRISDHYLTVSLSFSHWYPGSGVVLDRIDS